MFLVSSFESPNSLDSKYETQSRETNDSEDLNYDWAGAAFNGTGTQVAPASVER